jgi:DNA-binding NarL/FixJ family response regulator
MTDAPPVRVLIADDHRLFAEALGLSIGVDPRIEPVGRASNGEEAVRLALELRPDVVLMDLEMPVLDGIGATQAVREALPACRVIVLTAAPAAENVARARAAGAAAYLTKGCSTQDVIEAVLEVAAPDDSERKEETDSEREARTLRAAGRPRPLLPCAS